MVVDSFQKKFVMNVTRNNFEAIVKFEFPLQR